MSIQQATRAALVVAIIYTLAMAMLFCAGCGHSPSDPDSHDSHGKAASLAVVTPDGQVAVPIRDNQTVILDGRRVIRAVELYLASGTGN